MCYVVNTLALKLDVHLGMRPEPPKPHVENGIGEMMEVCLVLSTPGTTPGQPTVVQNSVVQKSFTSNPLLSDSDRCEWW